MTAYKILQFDEIDSTNSYALKNITVLSDKQVIIANNQTNGKGRNSNIWFSNNNENVYMSIVLKPSKTLNNNIPIQNLSQYMSVMLTRIFLKYNVQAQIKWPNDVLVNNKKIAGILTEASIRGNNLNGIVLGLGVNLNLTFEDLEHINQPAISLNMLTNNYISPHFFIKQLLDEFFNEYNTFLEIGFSYIKEEYEAKNSFIGKKVSVKLFDTVATGIIKELNADGTITMTNDDNKDVVITGGDIIYSSY